MKKIIGILIIIFIVQISVIGRAEEILITDFTEIREIKPIIVTSNYITDKESLKRVNDNNLNTYLDCTKSGTLLRFKFNKGYYFDSVEVTFDDSLYPKIITCATNSNYFPMDGATANQISISNPSHIQTINLKFFDKPISYISLNFKDYSSGVCRIKEIKFKVSGEDDTYKIISFDSNGGENEPTRGGIISGENFIISNNKPTREGYLFCGWSVENSSKIAQYQPGDEIKNINDNIILYAVWKATPTKVVYGNGEKALYFSEFKTFRASDGYKKIKVTKDAGLETEEIRYFDLNTFDSVSGDGEITCTFAVIYDNDSKKTENDIFTFELTK